MVYVNGNLMIEEIDYFVDQERDVIHFFDMELTKDDVISVTYYSRGY
jgi:hypothetical protein